MTGPNFLNPPNLLKRELELAKWEVYPLFIDGGENMPRNPRSYRILQGVSGTHVIIEPRKNALPCPQNTLTVYSGTF